MEQKCISEQNQGSGRKAEEVSRQPTVPTTTTDPVLHLALVVVSMMCQPDWPTVPRPDMRSDISLCLCEAVSG